MNESFENLMYRAGLTADGCWNDMDSYDQGAVMKFAELIVKECAEFVDYRLTNPDGASMAWCDGSDIKQHFGVE